MNSTKDFSAARRSFRIVMAGHVDHGKSTVVGRLLAETGSLPQGKLEQIRAYCERNSKPFEYAFLLDALKDEQNQGITIDAARIFFKTALRDYILIDAPGHVEFLKNMVSGAAHAEAALLVIDAKEGVRENSRRHGYMLSLLGIRQIVVLINKMDLVGCREEVFRSLVAEYDAFLRKIDVQAAHFIPVSGMQGDNIAAPSRAMPWHRGHTVLTALDAFAPERPPVDKPFRMPVQDVYKFTQMDDDRRIVAGTIESGRVSIGDEVVFYPSGKSSTVQSIERFPASGPRSAAAGAATGLTLTEQIYVRRGELAARRGEQAPAVTTQLRTSVFWLGRSPLIQGKEYLLKLGAARVAARLEKVLRVLDASTLETQENRTEIRRHEVADCVLSLQTAIAFDPADQNVSMGRFVLVDDYEIGGGGLIREALPDTQAAMRERVFIRNAKWQKSFVPSERREERYGHKAALVLVTGPRDSARKEIAKALETRLFQKGQFVYFLGIGSVLYGVDADIRTSHADHQEDIRRLAEVAHILLDSGLILIVSAAELNCGDLGIIETAIDRERIETVWVGDGIETDIPHAWVCAPDDIEKALDRIEVRLRERGFLLPQSPPLAEKPC